MSSKNGSAEVVLLVVLGAPVAYIIGSALLMSIVMWFGQPEYHGANYIEQPFDGGCTSVVSCGVAEAVCFGY